ncbi:MAG: DUF6298 domain-containing protein [Gaiellaceae bacterium]
MLVLLVALLVVVVGIGAYGIPSHASSNIVTWDTQSQFASAARHGTTANADGTVTLEGRPTLRTPRQSGSMGPLRRLRSNPRYFTADGKTAVYLTGSHTWINLPDGSRTDPPAAFDFPSYLADLERWHHNFIRLWAWDVTFESSRGYRFTYSPQPYVRSGPGRAIDGLPKFDLTRFNQAYFDRLRSRVVRARRAGIYVAVMLFEGYMADKGPLPSVYQGHPFAAENNVNAIDGDVDNDGRPREVYLLPGEGGLRKVSQIQKAYVRKVIDTVNDLDNVLYEIANEASSSSTAWQYDLIGYIKRYEARKRKQHPVGMTFQFADGRNATLIESAADWVSPRTRIDNPPAAKGAKVVLSDSDHLCGICAAANGDWAWREFARGRNPIYMDAYADPYWSSLTGSRDSARRGLGETRRLADRIDLASMRPQGRLASTGYVLSNPGREYVVYQPARGSFRLHLAQQGATSFTVDWISPGSAATSRETIAGGREVTLTPPFDTAVAAHIRANTHRTAGDFVVTHDAGKPRRWTRVTSRATIPARSRILIATRSSNDRVTWSPWRPRARGLPEGRYVQIRVGFSTTDADRTPILEALTLE